MTRYLRSLVLLIFSFSLFTHLGKAQNDAFIASHKLGANGVNWKLVEPVSKGFMLLGDSTWARTDTAGGILTAKSYSVNKHSFMATKFTNYLNRSLAIFQDSANSFVLLKIDSTGNTVWSKKYTVSSYNVASVNISLNKHTNSYQITGGLTPTNNSTVYGFIMKTDTAGNIDTTLMVKGDSVHTNYCTAVGPVIQGSDGSYYFTINGFLLGNPNTLLIMKTDSLLNINFTREFPAATPTSDGIILDGNKIYIASGSNNGFNNSAPAFLQLDNLLNLTRSLAFTLPGSGQFYSIRHTSDSGLVAVGSVVDSKRGGNQIPYVAKTDQLLDSMWTHTYPTLPTNPAINDVGHSIKQTSQGYIFAGTHLIKTGTTGNTPCNDSAMRGVTGTASGSLNYVPMTFAPLTITMATDSITAQPATITASYACFNRLTSDDELQAKSEEVRVFPNPSNGIFTISLSHPVPMAIRIVSGSHPTVEVYNMLGEKVYVAFLNPSIEGTTNTTVSLVGKSEGVYLYRVVNENGNLISAGKLVIQSR